MYAEIKQSTKVDIKQNNVSTVILLNKFLVYQQYPFARKSCCLHFYLHNEVRILYDTVPATLTFTFLSYPTVRISYPIVRLSYLIVRVSYKVFRLSYRENRLSGFAFIVYQVLRLSGFTFIVRIGIPRNFL